MFFSIQKNNTTKKVFMRKRIADLVFVLDASGSMRPLRGATISKVKEILQSEMNADNDEKVLVTISTFNQKNTIRCFRKPIGKIRNLTRRNYTPKGKTALYDAIINTIFLVEKEQEKMAPEDLKNSRTHFVVITDGLDDASEVFPVDCFVREMIKDKKNSGWKFLFIGSDFDVEERQSDGLPLWARNYLKMKRKGMEVSEGPIEFW